jgi:hypothetical protein
MSVAFTVAVYLAAGCAVLVWLAGQDRLPSGLPVRAAALVFWPAYLPICLSPKGAHAMTRDPALDGLREQIARLPVDEPRRQEYAQAVDRLSGALELKKRELVRLDQSEQRLAHLGGSFGAGSKPLVEVELERVRRAKSGIDRDIGRAREGILKLALRLELIDLSAGRGDLDQELASLEEEIDHLLTAREEVSA